MGKQSLVALDTDHIKQYVFATDKLKEIRGASSILDHLNRSIMKKVAEEPRFRAREVYAHGGSGLYLIQGDTDIAWEFGWRIQQEYSKMTHDGASITFVVQEVPETVQDAWTDDLHETLELLHYRLAAQKVSWLTEKEKSAAERTGEKRASLERLIAFPSHPFLRTCDACGLRYAEKRDTNEPLAEAIRGQYYCSVCLEKRTEDRQIKDGIDDLVARRMKKSADGRSQKLPFTWKKVIDALQENYSIPPGTERPEDFHALGNLSGRSGSKNYLAVIYADGNGMGQFLDNLKTLAEIKEAAETIDNALYQAIGAAISLHLPVAEGKSNTPRFPFDLLMVGGDDVMMVTPATPALDVAITLARKFHEQTRELTHKYNVNKDCSLSVGVVLAPVMYPFGMLYDLVEETLAFAKKEGAKRLKDQPAPGQTQVSAYGETLINFMTVTGSTSKAFDRAYELLHTKDKKVKMDERQEEAAFYATLRPYTIEELELLLKAIRDGRRMGLGRTKLHQVREAVLKKNLTTSVYDGLMVLRNWRSKQREFVMEHVYKLGGHYQKRYYDLEQPGSLFPRVIFPWFADGPATYRSSLLDFVELYDFVGYEGGADEN